MERNNEFSKFHPAVLLIYFVSILFIAMFTKNIWFQIILLSGGISFFVVLGLPKKILLAALLMFLLVAFTNPIFSHEGETVLFFLNGHRITLEAFVYGVKAGMMLSSVLIWFSNLGVTFTGEKILYIFSKVLPKTALILTMAVRLIPMYIRRGREIKDCRKTLGIANGNDTLEKLKESSRSFQTLMTYALENGVETGRSMKNRGYNGRKRSSYTIYRIRKADTIIIMATGVILVVVLLNHGFASYIMIAIMAFLPVVIELMEDIRWKYYRLKN